MTKKSETIVFFGNERIATGVATATPTLRSLVAKGYTVPLVVANNELSVSRKQRELEIATTAHELGIACILPKHVRDIEDKLRASNAQIGVLVAYGKIIPQDIINLFPKGIINIHPSLLPLHRGPTPIESVILNGETETGVSIMQLVKNMDAGPIYAQYRLSLKGDEKKQELADRLLGIGSDLLLDVLPQILASALEPIPQDEALATYDTLINKMDGAIRWTHPAEKIEREIRAFAEWPKSHAAFGNLEVTVLDAHIIEAHGKPGSTTILEKRPVIYCGSRALMLDVLKPAGKKEMTGEAFLAGYKTLFLNYS